MYKRFIVGSVIAFSMLANFPAVYVFAEDTAEELQAKINERAALIKKLDEEIKTYSDLADKSSKEALTLSSYIKTLDNQVKATTADIKKSQISIDKTNIEINKLSNEIVGKEEKVDRLQAGIRENIQNQYKLDNTSMVESFLQEGDILASIRQIQSALAVRSSIQDTIGEILNTKKDLEKDKVEGEAKKQELEKEKEALKTKQTSLNIVKDEQNKELAITKGQESNFKKILADRKAQKTAFEKEVFDYESKLKYVLNPGSIPQKNSSPLSWPLEKIIITQNFGVTSASGRLYASGSHNGTDFGAKVGTPVLSMGSGTLVAQGDTDLTCKGVSFGRWVLIKYDNGLASTYGHLSKYNVVATGARVKAGDIVGYSGNTGYTTGPHLHVSMYPADAVNATSRPSLSCPGRDLTMPIAAVNAYLDPLAYMPK